MTVIFDYNNWLHFEDYSHFIFMFIVALFLIVLQNSKIKTKSKVPKPIGIFILIFLLFIPVLIFSVKYKEYLFYKQKENLELTTIITGNVLSSVLNQDTITISFDNNKYHYKFPLTSRIKKYEFNQISSYKEVRLTVFEDVLLKIEAVQ